MSLAAYLPIDRSDALRRGADLLEHTQGAALLADLAGFTPFTTALTQQLGPRRGAEECTRHLNRVYEALIAVVHRYHGSIVGFSGDAITCWFDAMESRAAADAGRMPGSARRALACALGLQEALGSVPAWVLPTGESLALGLKVAVTSGGARRFLVGDPSIQVLDILAGTPLARLGIAETLAAPGEILLDASTAAALGSAVRLGAWRTAGGERFAVVRGLAAVVPATPWAEEEATLPDHLARPWLLPAVYARQQAGLGDFLTELRPAVALFLRFAGLDYEADQDAGRRLDLLVRRVQQVLARHEGALLHVTVGDKGSYLLAVFGAPLAHEDDVRRAARAALALQALPSDLDESEQGLDWLSPVQIGLSYGLMLTGLYGSAARRTYDVLGEEANVAARLMQQAAPGEVLLSGRVQRALGATFVLDPLPPLQLKGFPDPLPVFRLLHERAGTDLVQLLEPSGALPLVGRAAELAQLDALLERTLAGQGQVLGITAEAGMGKSRLVAELLVRARRRGLRLFGGACQSDGTSSPYRVWGPLWRGFFGLDAQASLRRQRRVLDDAVNTLAPTRAEALPLLGPLLGLPLPENASTRELEPRYRQAMLEALLLDCLRAAATAARQEGSGLLLILEDVHWIDPASQQLLDNLAGPIAELPVLVVLAYRPPDLLGVRSSRSEMLPHFTLMVLGPLTALEGEQVIRAKLARLLPDRVGMTTPVLVGRILARAEGNPFYIEELLNYLHDRGIDPSDVAALDGLELPDSLHSLLLSRIDRLSEREQVALKVASVLGRLVRISWLQGAYPVLGSPEEVQAELDELSRLDLIPLETAGPERTYVFKHAVTQEVAYESLAQATRAGLHEQLAGFLEVHMGADEQGRDAGPSATLDLDLGLLAYHYERSANGSRAQVYLRRAGDDAAARFANTAATDYFTRALALTPTTAATERYALLRAREGVFEIQGQRGAQRQDLEALTEVAEVLADLGRRSEAALRRAVLEEQVSDFRAATTAARQAVALAREAGLSAAEAAAQYQLGWVLWRDGNYAEARRPLERSLDLARALSDGRLESRILGSLGIVADLTNEFPLARRYYEQSLQAAQTSGDRLQEAKTLHDLGTLENQQGDFARARTYYEQSLSISRATGDRHMEGYAINNLASLAMRHGDYPGARAGIEQSLSIFRALDDQRMEGSTLANLSRVAQLQGDYTGARAGFEQSLAIFRSLDDRRMEGSALTSLARVAQYQGDFVAARAGYEHSLAIFRSLDDRRMEGFAVRQLGWLAQCAGDYAAAAASYMEALEIARASDDHYGETNIRNNLGTLLRNQGDGAGARASYEQALVGARARGDRREEGIALWGLGNVALDAGLLDEATAAYEAVVPVQQAAGNPAKVQEAVAGLALVALARGDLPVAHAHAAAILGYLDEGNSLDTADEPLRVELICYQVLQATDDTRAGAVLQAAYGRLQGYATQITDERLRRCYLETIPHHRALVAAYDTLHSRGMSRQDVPT